MFQTTNQLLFIAIHDDFRYFGNSQLNSGSLNPSATNQCQNSSKLLNVKNSGQVQEEGQEEDQDKDPDSASYRNPGTKFSFDRPHSIPSQRLLDVSTFQTCKPCGHWLSHMPNKMNMESLGCWKTQKLGAFFWVNSAACWMLQDLFRGNLYTWRVFDGTWWIISRWYPQL